MPPKLHFEEDQTIHTSAIQLIRESRLCFFFPSGKSSSRHTTCRTLSTSMHLKTATSPVQIQTLQILRKQIPIHDSQSPQGTAATEKCTFLQKHAFSCRDFKFLAEECSPHPPHKTAVSQRLHCRQPQEIVGVENQDV